MSDIAEAGAAAAVAPAETTETTQVEAPVEQPEPQAAVQPEPAGTDESVPARVRARDAYLKRSRQASEQPRDEQGKFVPTDVGETDQPVAEETVAATDEVPATEEVTPATEAAPAAEATGAIEDEQTAGADTEPPQQQTLVRIPIPEGHPLRESGQDHLAVSPESERAVRASLNSYTRRKDVEDAKAEAERQVQKVREELIRVRAELEAGAALRETLLRDPNIRARYEAVYEASPEDAELWLRGLEAAQAPEVRKKIEQEIEAARAETRAAQVTTAVETFKSDMRTLVRERFQPFADLPQMWGEDGLVEQAFQNYGAWLMLQEQRGKDVALDEETFVSKYLTPVLLGDTQVRVRLGEQRKNAEASREAARQREAEAKATAERKKAEEQRLLDAGRRHGTKSPIAAIPSQVRTGQQSTSAEDKPDFKGMSAADIKKHQRGRLFGH